MFADEICWLAYFFRYFYSSDEPAEKRLVPLALMIVGYVHTKAGVGLSSCLSTKLENCSLGLILREGVVLSCS